MLDRHKHKMKAVEALKTLCEDDVLVILDSTKAIENLFEDVDTNPYLNDFYEEMQRWSFNLQIYFLNSRLAQLLEIHHGTETVIQDRTIFEDANIFAPNLHEMGLMSKRDFDNYFQFFQTLKTMVQPPDLLIYLKCSVPTLVSQIQKRGREYEENIRLDYLKRLNENLNLHASTNGLN